MYKRQAQEYHAFAVAKKGTGQRIGDAKNMVFWSVLQALLARLERKGKMQEKQVLTQWFMAIVSTDGQVELGKMVHLGRFLSKCDVTPTKKLVYVELGWKPFMHTPIADLIRKELTEWGMENHTQRAPMPLMQDINEALMEMGLNGSGSTGSGGR